MIGLLVVGGCFGLVWLVMWLDSLSWSMAWDKIEDNWREERDNANRIY